MFAQMLERRRTSRGVMCKSHNGFLSVLTVCRRLFKVNIAMRRGVKVTDREQIDFSKCTDSESKLFIGSVVVVEFRCV